MKKLLLSNALLCLLIYIINPAQSSAGNGQIMFVAKLNTSNEVPSVRGDALGLVTFLLSEDRKEILIHGLFTNLTGPVIGCHIHMGQTGMNGPVLYDLTTYVAGNRIKASLPLPSGLLQLAQSGQLYFNVHSTVHPTGEIRGQLKMMTEYEVPVIASGVNLVPPDSSSTAYALGAMRFSNNLSKMHYEILPLGLSGALISAKIHEGAQFTNGPVLADLNASEFISGTLNDSSLVAKIFADIYLGQAYVSINTSTKPDGEIRADLSPGIGISGSGILNGDQEVPPVSTTALAFGYATMNALMDSITYLVAYKGVEPISAHIHQAPAGVSGPVMISLNLLVPGIYSGKSVLGEDQVTSLLKDELYFNIHSANNPGGEIRGQIQSVLMNSFGFDLCGDQEVPKKTVNGYGAAYVSINKTLSEMDYGMIVDGTNGDATAVRLYDGAFGSNGTTLLNLELPIPYISKVIPIATTISPKLDTDRGYINVHNAAYPTGEIRGQVRRSLSCKINTKNQQTNFSNITMVQNLTHQMISIETNFDQPKNVQVILMDATGSPVQRWETNVPAGQSNGNYKIESLSSGFYLLNVMEENKIIGVFKVVKL